MRHSGIIMILIAAVFTACGPSQTVSRVASDTQTDLSGRWNDTDARLVAEDMIADALSNVWLARFKNQHDKPPVAVVGRIRNETMEHIDTDVFTKEMERAFVNSGEVSVVADSEERKQIRAERQDQQSFASYETAAALAKEIGADFIMIGNISSIVDESVSGKLVAISYSINLELINVETNQKAWIGNKKIKKLIERSKLRG